MKRISWTCPHCDFHARATILAVVLVSALIAAVLFALVTKAQGVLVVRMPDAPRPGVVTPNAGAVLTGERFEVSAHYRVTIDGHAASIAHITDESVFFQIPAAARPGLQRTLYIEGPQLSRFLDIEIAPYFPMLRAQEGSAVAIITPRIFPEFVISAPIETNTEPLRLSLLGAGMVTGNTPVLEDGRPYVVLEDKTSAALEFLGEAFPFQLFIGEERVSFEVPPCFEGDYSARVRIANSISQPARLVFVSKCPPRFARRIRTWK